MVHEADASQGGASVIQSIDRAARILSSLQGARHLGITELAAILDLPPSTVHGLVKSLQQHGLVAREPGTSRYMLGPALLKLSNVYLDTLDVRARAMRWTAELALQLARVVERGIAHEEDEAVLGESSIAAPIADRSGQVIAAISVVLPTS